MKRFALLLLVAFTALSGYAQTTLTLEDAVLNGRKYYPQGLVMPQWVPGTDAYSHVTDGYQSLVVVDAKSGEETGRITAGEINETLEGVEVFGRRPNSDRTEVSIRGTWMLNWLDENTLVFHRRRERSTPTILQIKRPLHNIPWLLDIATCTSIPN